jgi:hypothetical protein
MKANPLDGLYPVSNLAGDSVAFDPAHPEKSRQVDAPYLAAGPKADNALLRRRAGLEFVRPK